MAAIKDMEKYPSPMTTAFLRPAYDRTETVSYTHLDVYKRQDQYASKVVMRSILEGRTYDNIENEKDV